MLSNDGADDVYPPSEDTHLLMDALTAEAPALSGRLCLEIGTGSGAVSRMLAEDLRLHVVASDVNPAALSYAAAALPPRRVCLVRGDLTAWARAAVFDVAVFNPPYVPTDAAEMDRARRECDIAASWAGGDRGREVIDACLRRVRRCLVDGGLFYLVVEKANGVDEVLAMAEVCGFGDAAVVREAVAGREKLFVLRFRAV